MPKITIGRDESDIEEYGEKTGTGFIGKHILGEKGEAHTANPVRMDIARPHVMGIFGKRGQGKSYTMGVIAEELLNAGPAVEDNISTIMIDSMGIFWSMKYPNNGQGTLLDQWGLSPQSMDIDLYIPQGHQEVFREREIPFDRTFAIKPGELNSGDWNLAFGIEPTDPMGILLERVISTLKDEIGLNYSIQDIINKTKEHEEFDVDVRRALVNRMETADSWGIFDTDGTTVEELTERGTVSIIDVSMFESISRGWSVRGLVVGLLARKLLKQRMESKRIEEIEEMEGLPTSDSPIVWMLIDEAHQYIPDEGKTPASNPLLQWAKIGREPGVSVVLATQQPARINPRVLSQMDLMLTHRLTAKSDIESLGEIMQTYMRYDITEYIDNLPRQNGAAIVLDDNSEHVYPIQIRPRMSWHAGGTPTAIKEERT
jgi:DNA helicase HerA-like ATPase